MKKRIISLILSCCMLLTIFAIPVAAQDSKTMVVIGDSISTGYGLEGYSATPAPNAKGSFANIISTTTGMAALNLAVDGLTSSQLLAALTTADDAQKAALGTASAISITIGGNDLIGALYTAMGTAIYSTDKNEITKAMVAAANGDTVRAANLATAIEEVTKNATVMATSFAANLTNIITILRTVNPTAPILVQTIANPYAKLPDVALVSAVDTGVSALNTVIKSGEATGAYKVVDVYTAFKNSTETLTNATSPTTPLDPHPNAAGHVVIAKLYAALVAPTPTAPPSTGVESQIPTLVSLITLSTLLFAIAFVIKKKSAQAK